MATVYEAIDLKHDRRVAVKVLRPELAGAVGTERFLREIQIAALLAHPHILPLHDSGEADGFVYYVMPFVDGESLHDRLAREHRLPVAEALRIVGEVADGLAYAHSRGVVHRDIKPENILFLGGHAVISDFGIATALDRATDPRLTDTGFVLGTPLYMSPEQALGDGTIDGRTDIYALACVLFEMLTGTVPFPASTSHGLLTQKLTEPLPRVVHLRPDVPPPLDAAIQQALAKEPGDRYASPLEFASAVTTAGAAAAAGARPSRRRLTLVGAGAAVLVLVFVASIVMREWRSRAGRPPAPDASIAVLPFENLGPPADQFFADGMTDEIASRLAAVSGLDLIPRRVTQRYARSDRTLREIGQALGIDYLLVGSVRWADASSGSRAARITLELVRARDERQLWSQTYDRVVDNIFDVQSDIAGNVIDTLGVALTERERSRVRARPTDNHEAYTLYLKGRYFWNKRTESDIQTALDYFQQAVDLDPGYSLAWVGIADGWIFRGFYSRRAPRDAFPVAKSAALRALSFDSTLAEAHASLAHVHFEFDHDWPAAEREYRRAIELSPRYATAHHWYGGFLSAMGRHEEALRQAEAARALDPLSLIIQTWVGLRHYFGRRPALAIAELEKALDLDRDFAPASWHLAWAYEQMGRLDDAVAAAQRAWTGDSANLVYLASLGAARARAGDDRQARAILGRLDAMARTQHVSAYHLAVLHLALRDTVAALDALERALEEQSPWVGYLAVDPRLDPLRSQPRFQTFLTRARLECRPCP
jgi:serine/threonine-protein kinase